MTETEAVDCQDPVRGGKDLGHYKLTSHLQFPDPGYLPSETSGCLQSTTNLSYTFLFIPDNFSLKNQYSEIQH